MFRGVVARIALPSLLLLGATGARAQTVTLDEGSFRLAVNNQDVGRETFSIKRNGSGANAVTIAQGRVVLESSGGRDLTSQLELSGADLRPAAYQINIQGTQPEKIAGRVGGGRFSARIVSPTGEQMREYLAGEGAVLVDEGLVHQYYFLAQRAAGGSSRVPVLIPQQNRQVIVTVTAGPTEPVDVAGQRVSGRRLDISGSGVADTRVWVDSGGRVLRVETPGHDFTATRTALPAS